MPRWTAVANSRTRTSIPKTSWSALQAIKFIARTKLYKLTPAQHVTLRGIRCAASGPGTLPPWRPTGSGRRVTGQGMAIATSGFAVMPSCSAKATAGRPTAGSKVAAATTPSRATGCAIQATCLSKRKRPRRTRTTATATTTTTTNMASVTATATRTTSRAWLLNEAKKAGIHCQLFSSADCQALKTQTSAHRA